MKVFDLICDQGHAFEGWFASDDDHRSQVERGLLSCPICESVSVSRRPSAPRLNLQHARGEGAGRSASAVEVSAPSAPPKDQVPVPPGLAERLQELQGAYVQMVRQVLSQTEDVGPRFAEEARRIHYGEAEQRHIRGQTSSKDLESLREEGIEVMSLPIPAGLDKPVH